MNETTKNDEDKNKIKKMLFNYNRKLKNIFAELYETCPDDEQIYMSIKYIENKFISNLDSCFKDIESNFYGYLVILLNTKEGQQMLNERKLVAGAGFEPATSEL